MNKSDKEKFILSANIENIKKMSLSEIENFCIKTREFLIDNVTNSGGHLASNLGMVEISAALIRVLDLPNDKIIYDTGHQSYVHKILTDRSEKFSTLRTLGGISGFPRIDESVYDSFGTGHSGTGLSAALGFAKAARLDGKKNWTCVVIGDGSFAGGEVFEALNNVSHGDRILIILNDNKMSISKSVGALRRTLTRLRTAKYYEAKDKIAECLGKIPLVGKYIYLFLKKVKNGIKRQVLPKNNLFEQYGLTYYGPSEGNDISTVEFLIREATKKDRPAIIHLCTKKGKGYAPAEQNPTAFHGISPKDAVKTNKKSFSEVFGEKLLSVAEKDEDVVAITAAMTDGVGLSKFAEKFPDRFFDTGIAEEHAMTFASALSLAGKKSVFAVYSTFFQRSFDQFIHDAALQRIPILVCLDRAGVVGEDGATHHGLCDIAIGNVCPGVEIYAPMSTNELSLCIDRVTERWEKPVIIRYPKACDSDVICDTFKGNCGIEIKKFGTDTDKSDVIFISFGRTLEGVILAAKELEKENISSAVVKFCALKGYSDEEFLDVFEKLKAKKVIFAEEGMKKGSFSESLIVLMDEKNILSDAEKKIIAPDETFVTHGKINELFDILGFTPEKMIGEAKNFGQN